MMVDKNDCTTGYIKYSTDWRVKKTNTPSPCKARTKTKHSNNKIVEQRCQRDSSHFSTIFSYSVLVNSVTSGSSVSSYLVSHQVSALHGRGCVFSSVRYTVGNVRQHFGNPLIQMSIKIHWFKRLLLIFSAQMSHSYHREKRQPLSGWVQYPNYPYGDDMSLCHFCFQMVPWVNELLTIVVLSVCRILDSWDRSW